MTPELGRPPAPPRADALVCRMAGALALMAGAVFLLCAVAVSRLPAGAGADGVAAYAIPGTRRFLDTGVVPLLSTVGLIASALGILVMVVGRLPQSVVNTTPVASRQRRRAPVKRHLLILLIGVAALAAVLWLKR